MYPYIILWWSKFYMTWIGIIFSFLVFLAIARYLAKKYHQNFWRLFYWLPLLIVLTYFFWSYINFFFDIWIFPTNLSELLLLFFPYGYKFHFFGIVVGMFISIMIFLGNIKRIENKKVWSDILFFSITLALVPLWLFLLMWDNFIGNPTTSWIGIKSLHSDSQRNKFVSVYPIWLFVSLWSLFVVLGIKIIKKNFGYWMLGFSWLLFLLGIIFMFQQYSRHVVFSLWNIVFDIKQYIAWFIMIICFFVYKYRKKHSI